MKKVPPFHRAINEIESKGITLVFPIKKNVEPLSLWKSFSGTYTRATKWCFSRFLIVGFGEVEDGAFPSLLIGSTTSIYEDLVQQAERLKLGEAQHIIDRSMPMGSPFRSHLERIFKS